MTLEDLSYLGLDVMKEKIFDWLDDLGRDKPGKLKIKTAQKHLE